MSDDSSGGFWGALLGAGAIALGTYAVIEGGKARSARKVEIEEEINTLLQNDNEKDFLDRVYELTRYDWTIWEEVLTPKATKDRSVAKLLTKAKGERVDWERYNPEST